jgi:CubicO group peptidase (beta-lactamase class C family)
VAVNGRLVWTQGYGYADLELKVPVTPETKFRIGSVSKSLTAAAVARLVQQGKLDVDVPVQRYVPTFPDKGVVITTREVGGHLAGIRHYRDDDFENCTHYKNVIDALDVFKNDPLIAPPGTKFSYSSYGFNLISAVVRGAAGESFRRYMHDNVFEPLGIKNTAPDEEDTLVPNRARFYVYAKDGSYRNAPSDEAEQLSNHLRDCILANKPDFHFTQAQLRKWAVVADRMLRLDHRDYEKAMGLIDWAESDEFWRTNILSMEKFRKQFDQLEVKRRAKKPQRKNGGAVDVSNL